jgi:hypothetical protein
MNPIYFFIPLLLGLGVVLFWLWRRMLCPATRLPVTANWIEELSLERYRPMMHLLDPEDFDFLRSQPGFTRKMESRLRQQRCQIFLGYLHCLQEDFARVAMALKLILAFSPHDRPDLAAILLRQQVRFGLGVVAMHVRLLLFRWDLCFVDVTGLIHIFDSMRLELQALVPAPAELAA